MDPVRILPVWQLKELILPTLSVDMTIISLDDKQSPVNSCVVSFFLPPLISSKDPPECIRTDKDLCYAGSVEIAGEASLEDLKIQVRSSPVLDMNTNTVIN